MPDPTFARKRGVSPLWEQIGDLLAKEIVAGELRPGTQLPTEPELMSRFGVGRHTVRQAMAELENRGLVRIEQGRGTFIHDHIIDYAISRRTRFSANLVGQGREPSEIVLDASEVPATAEIAAELGLRPEEAVHRVATASSADGVVIAASTMYFPVRRFPALCERRRALQSNTALFASYGISDYVRLVTHITARLPSEAEARLLRQPKTRPVLVTTKVDTDLDETPICYSEVLWVSDRVRLVVDPADLASER
ncbi:MAG: phosphonate metabolism transcriptional regulator PhnF [Hyphomicrobiales bacterium]